MEMDGRVGRCSWLIRSGFSCLHVAQDLAVQVRDKAARKDFERQRELELQRKEEDKWAKHLQQQQQQQQLALLTSSHSATRQGLATPQSHGDNMSMNMGMGTPRLASRGGTADSVRLVCDSRSLSNTTCVFCAVNFGRVIHFNSLAR